MVIQTDAWSKLNAITAHGPVHVLQPGSSLARAAVIRGTCCAAIPISRPSSSGRRFAAQRLSVAPPQPNHRLKRASSTVFALRSVISSPTANGSRSLQARAGTWQEAQLIVPVVDRRGSKNSRAPLSSQLDRAQHLFRYVQQQRVRGAQCGRGAGKGTYRPHFLGALREATLRRR